MHFNMSAKNPLGFALLPTETLYNGCATKIYGGQKVIGTQNKSRRGSAPSGPGLATLLLPFHLGLLVICLKYGL